MEHRNCPVSGHVHAFNQSWTPLTRVKLTLVGFVICCQENGDGSTDSGKNHGNDNALFASKPRSDLFHIRRKFERANLQKIQSPRVYSSSPSCSP